MTATNDITGDSIKSKPASDKYRESKLWENIGEAKKERTRSINRRLKKLGEGDQRMSRWIECNDWDKLPEGTFLVKIDKDRNPYNVAECSKNNQGSRIIIVGKYFHWDIGDIVAYTEFEPFEKDKADDCGISNSEWRELTAMADLVEAAHKHGLGGGALSSYTSAIRAGNSIKEAVAAATRSWDL